MKRIITASKADSIYYWNGIDKVPKDVVNVVIEDGVTTVNWWAFRRYSALTTVEISGSVEEIYPGAFSECKNLKSVKIDNPDVYMYNSPGCPYPFTDCPNLTDVEAAPEIKNKIMRYAHPKKRASFKNYQEQLRDALQLYQDPIYEGTQPGEYFQRLCGQAEEQLGIWLEPSIQGGVGSVTVRDSANHVLVEDIDFQRFDSSIIDIALWSKSPADFKRKYTSFLKRLLK